LSPGRGKEIRTRTGIRVRVKMLKGLQRLEKFKGFGELERLWVCADSKRHKAIIGEYSYNVK